MKNIKRLFLIAPVLLFLSSCGNESVRDTKQHPFVIMKISKTQDGHFIYSKGLWERPFREFFADGKQSIETDYDAGYRVGDTLRLIYKQTTITSNEQATR